MTDPPVSVCEICGAGPVEKLLFPVAVHFKGSGFYSTDYGRGSRKAAGKDSDAGSTSSDGAAKSEQPSTKSDAKSSESKSSDS